MQQYIDEYHVNLQRNRHPVYLDHDPELGQCVWIFANNSTPTTTLSQTLSNSGFVNESVIYHVLPAISGCTGDVTYYTVTVYPTPNLSNSPAAKQICNNQQTNVSLTSNVTGTLFTWTATPSSANVNGYSNNGTPPSSINQTAGEFGV